MIEKIATAVAATLVLTAPVHATDWYLINQMTGQCEPATKVGISSPDLYRKALARDGFRSTIEIARNTNEALLYVVVTRRSAQSHVLGETFWYPSLSHCEIARTDLGNWGEIPKDPDELK